MGNLGHPTGSHDEEQGKGTGFEETRHKPETGGHAPSDASGCAASDQQLLEALRESELRLKNLADNLPNVMLYQGMATPDGGRRFTYVGRGVERLNEVTSAEVLADAGVLYRQMLPEYQALVSEREEEAIRNLAAVHVEVQSRLPSGRLRWFEYTSTPRRRPDGLLVWDGVEVDITERKQVEEELERRVAERTEELIAANRRLEAEIEARARVQRALEESEALLVEAQHLSHIGSWHWDAASDTALWSGEMYAISGWDPSVPAPGFAESPLHFTAESLKRLWEARDNAMGSGQPYELELDMIRANGEMRNTVARGRVVRDGNGAITGLFGTLQDITEWKQAEMERRSLEAQMEHAQKLESLGVLAGGIAHDFNNILNIILGNAQYTHDLIPETSPARPFIDNIERASNRAAELTRQMLAYSGKGRFISRVLDLGATVREIAHLIQSSISKKVTIELDLDNDLPPIEADSAQIQQVAMNLILNASEALDEEHGGMVTVSALALHCTEDCLRGNLTPFTVPIGEYVCLEVSDTGCGMSGETKARLFDPFFTTKFTGRGLGMSAVLGIVRGHGGAILIDSAPGKGTTVRVLFPASARPMPELPDESPEICGTAPGSAHTILFVDDEADILEIGTFLLEQAGYTVITASSGLDAVEILRECVAEIDCAVLDLSMPRMDGMQTLLELRRIKPDIRAVLTSGYAREDVESRLAGHRVDAVLAKPYEFEVLSSKLREILG